MRDIRVLIEDFPQNKDQYTYFINNCKPFEKILFLNADNSSCLERLNKIPLDDPNYISSSELNKLLYDFEQKKNFYDFLKNNAKVEEINVNNHKILTIKQITIAIKYNKVVVQKIAFFSLIYFSASFIFFLYSVSFELCINSCSFKSKALHISGTKVISG